MSNKTEKTDKNDRATFELDGRTGMKAIESLVQRGDLSGLGSSERAKFYVQMCEGLGLNPHAQPFAFLRLNGKEVLYATRGATDQLAAIHRLTREIVDGPKVIDLAGTKLVYAVCRVTHPNGRVETATATVPLTDPVNVLMKCETKAKRRATLSILGLGVLDETELETIPASVREPGSRVDLNVHLAREEESVAATRDEPPAKAVPAEISPAAEEFYACLGEIELPGEAVAVWMKHRAKLAALSATERKAAWEALCKRTEEVGKMKNAKVWLKKSIAEAIAGLSDGDTAAGDIAAQVRRAHSCTGIAAVWHSAMPDLLRLQPQQRLHVWDASVERAIACGAFDALDDPMAAARGALLDAIQDATGVRPTPHATGVLLTPQEHGAAAAALQSVTECRAAAAQYLWSAEFVDALHERAAELGGTLR